MRCTSCNKFCSAEAEEPSVDDITVDVDVEAAKKWKEGDPSFVTVKATVSIEKNSECCGDNVANAIVEIEEIVDDEESLKAIQSLLTVVAPDIEEAEIEIEETEVNLVEEGVGKKATERVDVQWRIHCDDVTVGEGTSSGDVEWEDA